MKIKEAIEIINSTKTVRASLEKEKIYFYEYTVDKVDYFFVMPQKANNWDNVKEDFEALYSTTPKDLARVMDVIQRLLDTPVKDRFPEKKYCLRWFDDDAGKTFLGFCKSWGQKCWSLFDTQTSSTIFTESELEQFKRENPKLAPAIDAMKEPAEDKND
ncbi:hypothetical protein DKZ29_11650 [Limosilactobacillus reuteri]|uniref:hypothetical protein n=1 Tax=Limosilactobacillus reuteri TaxID=1598 RepID=UPI000D6FA50B|nr:hypothetical protein [Limosilactobacillus reuteri]PWT56480.1 hypothetical protein DKZ29_11650 [Limosilactobacillus reuteri]